MSIRPKVVLLSFVFGMFLLSQSTFAKVPTGKKITVDVNKKRCFSLTLLPKWSVKKWDKTILVPPAEYPHILIWEVKDCKDVKAAEKKVKEVIKSEVIKFKVKSTKNLKLKGLKVALITGEGLEADDQDPSNADVFLFAVKGKVFVLCSHGEGDGNAKVRDSIIKILSTLK